MGTSTEVFFLKPFKDIVIGEFFEFEFSIYKKTDPEGPWNAVRCENDQPAQFDDEEFCIEIV